jgi:hypothetical protein
MQYPSEEEIKEGYLWLPENLNCKLIGYLFCFSIQSNEHIFRIF